MTLLPEGSWLHHYANSLIEPNNIPSTLSHIKRALSEEILPIVSIALTVGCILTAASTLLACVSPPLLGLVLVVTEIASFVFSWDVYQVKQTFEHFLDLTLQLEQDPSPRNLKEKLLDSHHTVDQFKTSTLITHLLFESEFEMIQNALLQQEGLF